MKEELELVRYPCPECYEYGYTTEHDPHCDGGERCGFTCPIPVQCEWCDGKGYTENMEPVPKED